MHQVMPSIRTSKSFALNVVKSLVVPSIQAQNTDSLEQMSDVAAIPAALAPQQITDFLRAASAQ
jgi:hypothetical protein